MSINYINSEEYIYYQNFQQKLQIECKSDCSLIIKTPKSKDQEKIIIAPITYCHFQEQNKRVYLGEAFGDILVIDIEGINQVTHFKVGKGTDELDEDQIIIMNRLKMYSYNKFTFKLKKILLQFDSYLLSASKLNDTVVLSFQDISYPIILYGKQIRYSDQYFRNQRHCDQQIKITHIKLHGKKLGLIQQVNKIQRRISIYKLQQRQKTKIISIKFNYLIIDFIFNQQFLFFFGDTTFEIINLSKKMQMKMETVRTDRLKLFKEITNRI